MLKLINNLYHYLKKKLYINKTIMYKLFCKIKISKKYKYLYKGYINITLENT